MRCWPRHRRKHRMRKLKKVAFSHFFDTLKRRQKCRRFFTGRLRPEQDICRPPACRYSCHRHPKGCSPCSFLEVRLPHVRPVVRLWKRSSSAPDPSPVFFDSSCFITPWLVYPIQGKISGATTPAGISYLAIPLPHRACWGDGRSPSVKSLTASAAKRNPATGGTNATLPGVCLRGESSCKSGFSSRGTGSSRE